MYVCVYVCMYVCILPLCRGFRGLISGFETFVFFTVRGPQPLAQPPTWRTRVSLSVWIIPFDLSGLGDPTSSYATAGVALRVFWSRKPHHYVKVETPSGGGLYIYRRFYRESNLGLVFSTQYAVVNSFSLAVRSLRKARRSNHRGYLKWPLSWRNSTVSGRSPHPTNFSV
jgi:hypothetical protein